ncbi:hypothetical protein ACSBR2_037199 [Camellia fascicularis]
MFEEDRSNNDNVYGFSDEDRDLNATVDDEHESNDNESLSDKGNEESNEDDNNVLSDYQFGDDEVRYSSSDYEFDGEVKWMDNEEMAYLGNQFDSTYSGKEPYFNQEE